MTVSQTRLLAGIAMALMGAARVSAFASRVTHEYTFEDPMSWADDISPWGLGGVQSWNITEGDKPGKALRISAAAYKQAVSFEIRTLQFNHQPGTRATISFDIKPVSVPAGSMFVVRHFDGYCGAFAFEKIADDEFAPFPAPIWDSRTAEPGGKWRHVSHETETLNNTVLTIAIIAMQPPPPTTRPAGEPDHIEYRLDNLRVETILLERLMDAGFDWHGNAGSNTIDFRYNTRAADADWCDFSDQEDAPTADGGVIHFTMLPHRSSSSYPEPGWAYQVGHETCSREVGGFSTIALRAGGDRGCAVSWGVRQTVAYSALGLGPRQAARIRVAIKMTNLDPELHRISKVQLGVDPRGGVITRRATWSPEDDVNCYEEGWRTVALEFDRPEDADGLTIYFRRRDGVPREPKEKSHFPEPQSQGTPGGHAAGFADWVVVEVVR